MPERIVRPGILTSEPVNRLSWPAEVFYRRLMSIVDDFGRYDGRPAILRASLYPLLLERVREADVASWIGECHEAGLVRLYQCPGSKPHVELLKFDQRLRAKKSKWPSSACERVPAHANASESESDTESSAEKGAGAFFENLLPEQFGKEARRLWRDFAQLQVDCKRPYSPITVGPVFREFEQRGEVAVIEALTYSLKNRTRGVTFKRDSSPAAGGDFKFKPIPGPARSEEA